MKNLNYLGLKTINMGFDGHLTISYLGPHSVTEELKTELEQFKEIRHLKNNHDAFHATPLGLDIFGNPNYPKIVLKIQVNAYLTHMATILRSQFKPHSSSWQHWTPHITIPRMTKFKVPDVIYFTELDFY